ncbi:aldo/keto reductase (plasmid) [Halorussus limi]|uniref:Aldo/keto reductase n=1 Tax=Halorussus limi TaxID=2938695 RepID=A0A8U0HZW1_9EURY|nr:aldo/keto reductase [Halorussus limi]UPV76468.1 aldo/keto reductase [Halorussus limi]
MEYVETGGARIPKLGLGTWQNTGSECTETVRTALDLGYRHVDTAQAYDNEAAVGEGIARAEVDRDEVFLTTKVWRSNLRYDDVLDSVRDSLDRLGVEYVDLLLAHWPHPRVPVAETLEAMTELRESGAVKNVGVSNFTLSQLREARGVADVPLVANQVLYHPYKDQSDLQRYCATNGVALVAYSPLARGDVLSDDLLERIGDRYDKTAAQVALRWLLQQDGVVAIPKASSRAHLEQNADVFDFSLTDEEAARIDDRTGSPKVRLRNCLPSLVRRVPF